MASPIQWTWVWVSSGSWWWTGSPNVLPSMGSQGVRHNWVTELNWKLCLALWDLTDRNTPGFLALHFLLEFALCPLSEWSYLTILSSADSSFCFQSFPASGSFLLSRLFTSSGQSIGAFSSEVSANDIVHILYKVFSKNFQTVPGLSSYTLAYFNLKNIITFFMHKP